MKKYCYIKDNNIVEVVESLPINWRNISNFYTLDDDALKNLGWLPVVLDTDVKDVILNVSYEIVDDVVKETVVSRDKTEEELQGEALAEKVEAWLEVRNARNNLLAQSDISIVSDKWELMDVATKSAWTTYRQALRDIPDVFNTPTDVVWPTKPV